VKGGEIKPKTESGEDCSSLFAFIGSSGLCYF